MLFILYLCVCFIIHSYMVQDLYNFIWILTSLTHRGQFARCSVSLSQNKCFHIPNDYKTKRVGFRTPVLSNSMHVHAVLRFNLFLYASIYWCFALHGVNSTMFSLEDCTTDRWQRHLVITCPENVIITRYIRDSIGWSSRQYTAHKDRRSFRYTSWRPATCCVLAKNTRSFFS